MERSPKEICVESATALTNSFLLAYGSRSVLSFVLKLTRIFKTPKEAGKLIAGCFGKESLRFGLFVGGFSGLYRLSLLLLKKFRGESCPSNALVAGAVASAALLFEEEGQRVTFSHYLLVRALQCIYNAMKARGYFDFLEGNLRHGDSLLFAISSAQVMFAYAIRPETIPSSYYKFILQTGPIDEEVLQAVRKNVRGLPVDVPFLNKYVEVRGGPSNYLTTAFPPYISNQILHPWQPNWIKQAAQVFLDVFGKITPVYLSLTFVPMAVLRLKDLLKRPLHNISHGVISAGRSSAFLATFVSAYMFFTSAHRRLLDIQFADMKYDHKLVYWVIGFLASWSILVEKKSRRSELALYALPRAVDSIYEIMYLHKIFPKFKYGEMLIFATAMSVIMHFHENEQDTISPLLNSILLRFLDSK